MKKFLGIFLASALAVGAMCFTATAEGEAADVSFAPAQSVIEVEPGQQKIELKYHYTKNNGWAIMNWYFVADQKVISFNELKKNGTIAEGNFSGVAYRILEKYYDEETEETTTAALAITPNMYGLSKSYNPATLKTNESKMLIECANIAVGDKTAVGEDFMSFYINIADDAKSGDYVMQIYTENETAANNINAAKENINVTIDPVTIRVKGSDTPVGDERLNVTGAQIRVPSQGSTTETQGLRFVSTITEELYNKLNKPASASDTGLGFGTVVFPTKWLGEGELLTKETSKDGKNAMIVPAVKLFAAPTGTTVTYTACMTGLAQDAAALTTAYTVVPYATYMDGETEVTVYGEQYSTTVFDVAKAAFESGKESTYVNEYLYNEILNVVDPTTYNEPQKWSNVYKPGA